MLDILSPESISRRQAFEKWGRLIGGAALATIAQLAPSEVNPIFAESYTEADIPVWSHQQWFPLNPLKKELVRAQTGVELTLLHDVGGPLHIFDVIYERRFGKPSYARVWQEDFASRKVNENPNRLDLGLCHAQANAIAQGRPRPQIAFNETVEGIAVDETTKVGLLSALHAYDAYFPVDLHQLDAFLADFHRRKKAFVADIPAEPGQWFRVIWAVSQDLQTVKATNWGRGDQAVFGKDSIKWIHLPFHYTDLNRPAYKYRVLTEEWMNPYIRPNEDLVLQLVYPS